MAMNYVGNISILDRGDAPAQAVLDRNARTLAKRVADETKEDLAKVMQRVDHIYGNFELTTNLLDSNRTASIEYANDMAELADIIGDQVKKKKYQQQVTIFIVGYENVCGQKLRLLQQVNEFFMENSSKFEEEDVAIQSPDLELDDMAEVVEETLKTSESLARRLGELNKEMVEYMYNYAQAKASNNPYEFQMMQQKITESRGKKKLERALGQAREDASNMQDKLQALQQEVEDREERMQQLYKQIEMKNMEAQRYKTAAEVAKRNAGEADKLRDEIIKRDDRIKELRLDIDKLETELGHIMNSDEHVTTRLPQTKDESVDKLQEVQKVLEDTTNENHPSIERESLPSSDGRKELQHTFEIQLDEVRNAHSKDMEEMKIQHAEEIKRLLQTLGNQVQMNQQPALGIVPKLIPADSGQPNTNDSASIKSVEGGAVMHSKDITKEPGDHSRAVTKEKTKDKVKQVNRNMKGGQRQSVLDDTNDSHEVEDNDKIDARKNPALSKSTVKVTAESVNDTMDFQDQFDIMDEESWVNIPREHLIGRFNQYRQLTYKKMYELEGNIEETVLKTQRKIQTLKAQFQEHKKKWETEREIILQHIDQAASLQEQAENEADAAMTQLDEFITEQELLENEEESKRKSLSMAFVKGSTQSLLDTENALHVAKEQQHIKEKEFEENLLSQTDDAKVNLSRKAEGTFGSVGSIDHVLEDTIEMSGRSRTSPEELARSSSLSRQSLRELHKQALSSLKVSAESRKTRSPSLYSMKDQKSVLSTAVLDEDGDMPFPPDETRDERELKERRPAVQDMATSPITSVHREKTSDTLLTNPFSLLSRSPTVPEIKIKEDLSDLGESLGHVDTWKSIPMYEHPIAQEFFRGYDVVINFKNNLGRTLIDKEFMSAGQVLVDIEPHAIDCDGKIQPQVEQMTSQMNDILEHCLNLIENIVRNDQECLVSSITNMSDERDINGMFTRENTDISSKVRRHDDVPLRNGSTAAMTDEHMKSLQKQYSGLENSLQKERKKHEEQLQHNTVLMMEMQDTISALQRELSIQGKNKKAVGEQNGDVPGSPVMFTRLDSERNAKILKKAMNEKRLDTDQYMSAVKAMEDYGTLPARRFISLVNKYVHHCQMKEIEANVRRSRCLNNGVFDILERMESLQNERAKRWAEKMDDISSDRQNLAELLMDTFENIEKESGIFLIKPFYSYQALRIPARLQSKRNRPYQQLYSHIAGISSEVPAPTPASNKRIFPKHNIETNQNKSDRLAEGDVDSSFYDDKVENGLSGKATQLIGDYPRPVWVPTVARSKPLEPGDESALLQSNFLNTPRMLELDINRMLIGQNQISIRISPNFTSNDHLANASNNNVRAYMSVNRPTGKHIPEGTEKPMLNAGVPDHTGVQVPPTTPLGGSTHSGNLIARPSSQINTCEESIQHVPSLLPSKYSASACRNLPSTPPLPPISGKLEKDLPLPPLSPPGSSLRQTPPLNLMTK